MNQHEKLIKLRGSSTMPSNVFQNTDLPADERTLRARLAALFEATDGNALSIHEILADPNRVPKNEAFCVKFGDQDGGLDNWLEQPNEAFGDRTPASFLEGTEQERQFMDRFIGALEQGVFS